jgi:hypothetical protein
MCLNFGSFKNFALLCSRVGAGAGAAKNFYPEPKPHKNDAAPQHIVRITFLN